MINIRQDMKQSMNMMSVLHLKSNIRKIKVISVWKYWKMETVSFL